MENKDTAEKGVQSSAFIQWKLLNRNPVKWTNQIKLAIEYEPKWTNLQQNHFNLIFFRQTGLLPDKSGRLVFAGPVILHKHLRSFSTKPTVKRTHFSTCTYIKEKKEK